MSTSLNYAPNDVAYSLFSDFYLTSKAKNTIHAVRCAVESKESPVRVPNFFSVTARAHAELCPEAQSNFHNLNSSTICS